MPARTRLHVVGQSYGGAVAGVYAALDGAAISRSKKALDDAPSASASLSLPPLAGVTLLTAAVESPYGPVLAPGETAWDFSWFLPNSMEDFRRMVSRCFHQPDSFCVPRLVCSLN